MKKQKHAKRWTKLAIMLLSVLLVFTACQKEEDIVTPEKSSFEISISGILTDYYEEYLPQLPLYSVYVRMHDLPDDEKIVSWGSCVSSRNTTPEQCQRIAHTLRSGYFIPGGKTEAEKKSMIYSDCPTSFPPGKIIM